MEVGHENDHVLGKVMGRERGLFPRSSPWEAPGEQIFPALACSWFCHLAITTACLGNPCAFSPGNSQAPVLYLNASSAQEGEIVLLRCSIDEQFPATRVVFCKNGQEEFSLKAQQGRLIYTMDLNITSRSAGTYKCGYQQKNKENWVRNSALSAPQTLSVAGAGETTTDIQSSTAPHARILHTLPTGTVLAVAAVGLVLLAAGSWFAIRKGACRGRCPRHQHIDRPQMEDTSNGEVQCEYYLLPWGKPHAPLTMVTPAYAFPMQSHHFISHWDIQNPCPFIKTRFLSSTSCPASSLHAECVRLHKGHGSIPVLPGTKPICLGDPSTPAPASGSISPASASAFVLSSVSCQRNFCSEKQKAPRSNERCGSLPWWGKHFIVCSETTSSTKERMLWLGDRL
nr:uncharacterized protein LOC113840747 isoform X3 [Anas platyrhynchos]